MNAGKLRHLITIQNMDFPQDGTTGVVTPTPSTFAQVWAEVRPSSAREFIAAGISGSKVVTAVKIRYLPGVKASMRIVHGDQTLNIEGVLPDPKSGREWLLLPCSEVQHG